MDLCIIEGDGIGHEVIPAAIEVLKHLIPNLNIHIGYAGWSTFQETGTPLPEETIELAKKCKAILYGASTTPAQQPDGYFFPIVRLRQELNTYANIRPTRYMPVPTARAGVDLVVVRENTEDLYFGEDLIQTQDEVGTATKMITRVATERISHTAYKMASLVNKRRVTIVHKANVMPNTDGLFLRVAKETAREYPNLIIDDLLVDTAAYWMVKDPSRFEIILAPNLYGDILSDMAAAWGGGIGLAPSLNWGNDSAIAQPVHGSAMDIAGKEIANPTAMILSAALLIRYYWRLPEVAIRIERAVAKVFEDHFYTADIYSEQSVSTSRFTELICSKL